MYMLFTLHIEVPVSVSSPQSDGAEENVTLVVLELLSQKETILYGESLFRSPAGSRRHQWDSKPLPSSICERLCRMAAAEADTSAGPACHSVTYRRIACIACIQRTPVSVATVTIKHLRHS